MNTKKYDVIVFGATSFVGQILCRYLLGEFGTADKPGTRQLRWAIAGRSKSKLETLIGELGTKDVAIITADADDAAALTAMATQTRVLVSTVGPYALFGDTLVKVCAENGTDYCDLTGEAHWVRKMIATNEAAAKLSGARIVNCCGFDSIPSDLGVMYLQQQSMLHYGEPCVSVQMRVKAMRGAASGGTVASMLNIVREATRDKALRREYANPYSLCVGTAATAPPKTKQHNVTGAEFDGDHKTWVAPFVMAAINTRIVLRSHSLLGNTYGSSFQYNEAMMMGKGFGGRTRAVTFSAGLAGFLVGAAIAPTRWLMEKTFLPAPGDGPSPAAQQRGFWDYRFVGHTADGRELRVKVTGDRDPGYGSTAKMLGEAAACLALDISKDAVAGGFWTPSTAMGQPLMARLIKHAGVSFALIE
jgi:short subunit dehydrogenase-like uncharacterized protein